MKSRLFSFMIFLFFIFTTNIYAHHKPINVTIVSPSSDDNNFWGIVHNFARSSAKDLNINLKIIYAKNANNFTYVPHFETAFKSSEKPDIVIGIFFKTLVDEILELSKKYDTPIFMFNSIISENERNDNHIRKEYKNFIGYMHPDEEYAGYILAKHLIKIQKNKNPNKKINLVGISGHRNSFTTHLRNIGLQKAVKEEKANLNQLVHANWSEDISYIKANRLMDRYSNLDIIWTASDLMAISSKKAINNKQKNNIITGGIDWTKDGIAKVKNGELEASVGGHFSEIGFALVLIHDYFHGKDFYDEFGGEITTKMLLLNSENINKYYDFLTIQDWDKIDFTKYSKVLNPNIQKYDFSFESLLENYNNQ